MKLNKKGFSLIELMVVLIIIGILSSVMIPKIVGRLTVEKYCDELSDDTEYCGEFMHSSIRDFNTQYSDIERLRKNKIPFIDFIQMECEMQGHCTPMFIQKNTVKTEVKAVPLPPVPDPSPINNVKWKVLLDNKVIFYNTHSETFLSDVEEYKKQSEWSEYTAIKHMVNLDDGILVEFR